MCGRHEPHLHHIDEDPSHNEVENLLPLCPNCHLQDIHDPTGTPDINKILLFRKFKDPLILDPRFHPIFTRTKFLYAHDAPERTQTFKFYNEELVDLVSELKLGGFYRKKIDYHLKYFCTHYAHKLRIDGIEARKNEILHDPTLRIAAHQYSVECVEQLLVELLRYQEWIPDSRT